MTSSLVGSEMCIRDSIKSNGKDSGRPVALGRLFHIHLPRHMLRVASEAVSYTHLTLPTICSV
eukprot:9823999-Prorocentrum_lima.AAC.1